MQFSYLDLMYVRVSLIIQAQYLTQRRSCQQTEDEALLSLNFQNGRKFWSHDRWCATLVHIVNFTDAFVLLSP